MLNKPQLQLLLSVANRVSLALDEAKTSSGPPLGEHEAHSHFCNSRPLSNYSPQMKAATKQAEQAASAAHHLGPSLRGPDSPSGSFGHPDDGSSVEPEYIVGGPFSAGSQQQQSGAKNRQLRAPSLVQLAKLFRRTQQQPQQQQQPKRASSRPAGGTGAANGSSSSGVSIRQGLLQRRHGGPGAGGGSEYQQLDEEQGLDLTPAQDMSASASSLPKRHSASGYGQLVDEAEDGEQGHSNHHHGEQQLSQSYTPMSSRAHHQEPQQQLLAPRLPSSIGKAAPSEPAVQEDKRPLTTFRLSLASIVVHMVSEADSTASSTAASTSTSTIEEPFSGGPTRLDFGAAGDGAPTDLLSMFPSISSSTPHRGEGQGASASDRPVKPFAGVELHGTRFEYVKRRMDTTMAVNVRDLRLRDYFSHHRRGDHSDLPCCEALKLFRSAE